MSLGYIGNSLPAGWETPLLTDLVTPKQWRTISTKELIDDGYIVYGANGKIGFYSEYTHEYPTLMITCRGATCGNLHISDPYSYINGNAMALDGLPDHLVDIQFLYYALKARGLVDTISGSAQPQITGQGLKKVRVPLPSFSEQKIIVDKLDTLLAQVDSTKVRLEQIPQILKRFRQAVLAAAVSGKLTEEWREQNKISSDWKSVQFLELITKLRSGSGDTPSDNVCGIPILRSSAIRPQIINYEDVRYLSSEETLNEDNYLKNGDLLFTRLSGSADYVGNCALVKGLTKKYQYPDRLFCARLKDQRNANYLEYFCSSNIFREHIIKSIKSSAGHQRITLDAIRTAQIFIPDYLEQTEIVRRVEQLFAYADGIEKQVQNALERVNNLTQSILAKAFRGELTTQWRAENPDLISGENSAQALLAKIQQQRSNTKTIKRSKGNS
ncbi:restriction endonuclease subunit S [Citrobacter braakii]|uniref:restriction endonuclease subunit S n=1 Tax=Citrobacter braakii TaxID=57706 RepID=UPI0019089780|nr:restriction endonuclease subunit S [Citrobacter braakii]MBJ9536829.1 restriction endonuclease subunit S [Citrobacter braakii]MBJ9585752.1 restriction endonuclease subunit S [Citrobacter braakii]